MLSNRQLSFAAAALALAVPITAQTYWYNPPRSADNWETSGSGVGIARPVGRAQFFHENMLPPGTVITAIAWRVRSGQANQGGFTIDAEIRLGESAATQGTFSTDFSANVAACTSYAVIFPRAGLNVPVFPANSSPRDWINIPTNAPFFYSGPTLMAEAETYGVLAGTENMSLDRCRYDPVSGAVIGFGESCGTAAISVAEASFSDNYLPGTAPLVNLTGAPSATFAAVILGFSAARYNNIPLPMPLDSVGMNGCTLLTSMDAIIQQPTDGNGAASLAVPIPNAPLLSNKIVNFQWIYFDPTVVAPLKLVTTRAYAMLIGPQSCPGIGYNYTWTAGAPTGTVNQTDGPILRVTTTP